MTIQDLKDQGLIIFEAISGSVAYGLNLPTSDVDRKGVYILPDEQTCGLRSRYVGQVSDGTNDTTYYELSRFVELLNTGNPNILELLFTPADCILFKDPIFDKMLIRRSLFLTRYCKNTFSEYARMQISKARGLNKKVMQKMEKKRKSPLDFCYTFKEGGSIPIKDFLRENEKDLRFSFNADQKFCGLAKVNHMRDMYAVYFDTAAAWKEHMALSGADYENVPSLNYKGIIQSENSNEVSLSSIPEGQEPVCYMSFNRDGYSTYCKDYKNYWDWDKAKNPVRFAETMAIGKGYDAKNLMHCHRLLDMAIEIASGKGLIVRRENREELLSIRRGEREYNELVKSAEEKVELASSLFDKSSLPEKADEESANRLILDMRLAFFNQKTHR